jgi:hypothetical protein
MSPSEQIQNEIILILKEINRENLQMEVILMYTNKMFSYQFNTILKYSCYNFNN